MKRALREALTECLARLEAGAGIEDCLRDQGSLAGELRPLLEAARTVRRRQGSIPVHSPTAFQRGRTRMHVARVRQAEGGRRRPWAWLFGPPAALVAVGTVATVLAALGLTTNLLRIDAGTTSADVQGVVSRVDTDAVELTTVDGMLLIRIGENTVVHDALGNAITGDDLVPGEPARAEVEEENGEYSAERIEVEDEGEVEVHNTEVEFSGVVQTVSGDTIKVQASFGLATVRTNDESEVKGTLVDGVDVEVHATLQEDASYLAREIKVEARNGDDEGGGGHSDDGGNSSGSGSGDGGSDNSSSDDEKDKDKDGDGEGEEND